MTRVNERFLANEIIQEAPSGTIDGVNDSFTLSQMPENASSVSLYLNGILLDQGTDYTILGTTITMTSAPALAQKLTAVYTLK